MKEKNYLNGKTPYNQEAKKIGVVLSQLSRIEETTKVKTLYGLLTRIGKPRTKPDFPSDYQHKKHLFEGRIKDQPVVILHFSGETYGPDETYFRRIYQNSRDIFSGQATQFTERKIAPSLLGDDDQTMTLLIEKAPRDLTFYFSSTNEKEIRRTIKNSIELIKHVWEKSKEKNDQFPRYVAAFLEPEYPFLKNKKPEDYLKDPKVIGFYLQTQGALKEYFDQLNQFQFKRGFGFGDVQPSNLVEDKNGKILFIDVGKPEFSYHWVSMLGQFYQATIEKAPNSLFSKVLKQKIAQVLESHPEVELTVKLFALGRMNCYLLGCSLRNMAFAAEIDSPIDESRIRDTLAKVRYLTKITSTEEVIKYASDEFDSHWRERLKDYPQTPEYKENLKLLKKELDQTLPQEKPDRELVFVFMGIPGSGKSAIAKIIKPLHPSIILRSDWIFFQKLRDQIEDDYYKAYVYQEDLARNYLQEGYSVVMDDNNRTIKNRYGVYQWARAYGAKPILIIVNVDLEMAADGITMKGGETRTKEEKIKGLKNALLQIEEPTPEEKQLVKIIKVDGNKSLEVIKNQLKNEIQNL